MLPAKREPESAGEQVADGHRGYANFDPEPFLGHPRLRRVFPSVSIVTLKKVVGQDANPEQHPEEVNDNDK